MAHITKCRQCGVMVCNSDLCNLCKEGHTAQESVQIRIEESLSQARRVSRVLSKVNTSKSIAKEKTTY